MPFSRPLLPPTASLGNRAQIHGRFEMLGMPQRDITPEAAAERLRAAAAGAVERRRNGHAAILPKGCGRDQLPGLSGVSCVCPVALLSRPERRSRDHRRAWTECGGAAGQALCGDGFAGRLPLRLCPEVWRQTSVGAWRAGRHSGPGNDPVLSLADLSQPLHPGDRAISRAPRHCGQQLL